MKRTFLFSVVPLALIGACSNLVDGRVGSVQATITSVPGDVACVQIIAAGGRTVTNNFDVVPGRSSVVQISNLPVGNLLFTAFAYASACASTTGAQPSWASTPTSATLLPGQVTNVSLTLDPVAGASVGVNFDTDMGAPPDLSHVPDLAFPPDLTMPAPAQLVAPATVIDFGVVSYGVSVQRDVSFVNVGGAPTGPLNISSSPQSPPFIILGQTCYTSLLQPNQSCVVTVRFTPEALFPNSTTLGFSATPGGEARVTLKGAGQ